MPGLALTYHFALSMGDIGKPIRETERPAPVRTPVPEREPVPERTPAPPPPREPAPAGTLRA